MVDMVDDLDYLHIERCVSGENNFLKINLLTF